MPMTEYKKYILTFSTVAIGLLSVIAAVNVIFDPAGVYGNNSTVAKEYVRKLEQSQYGLLKPRNSWGERDIKKALAQQAKRTDCVIIGSSHVMQISSVRENRSLVNHCPTLINLGVSGGTLEDYIALSYEVIKVNHPKYIIFGIDPWGLDFNRDSRFSAYQDSYDKAIGVNKVSADINRSYSSNINLDFFITLIKKIRLSMKKYLKLAQNSVNFEYFVKSVKSINGSKNHHKKPNELFVEVSDFFSHQDGYREAVTLSDGSHVYSKDYISKNTPPKVKIGGTNYKIKRGSQINGKAITLFMDWVQSIESDGVGIIFLMTPYHPNVWADKNSSTTKALLEMESVIKALGEKHNIPVLGSYNPKKIGCDGDEFYDFMHATASCLSKIKH